jgi:uncharacterized membrane protein
MTIKTIITIWLAMFLTGCGDKQDPLSGADVGNNGEVTYTEHIKSILDANCIGCHAVDKQGASRNGAPVGINFDTYQAAKSSGTRANQLIQAGTMPIGGQLSSEDKSLFQQWANQNFPE